MPRKSSIRVNLASDPASDAVQTLGAAGLTVGMTPDEAGALASLAKLKRYRGGAVILHEDARSRDLYVIREGRVGVRVRLPGSEGREEIVYTMRDGQIFGELSLVDGSPRSASVIAEGEVAVYRLAYSAVLRLLDSRPHIGYLLMRNLAAIIANRVRSTNLMWRNTMLW